jgi:hypothetical protein
MAASSAYQTAHLAPAGDITGSERFRVAGLLYAVQEQIKQGDTAANAVTRVLSQPRAYKILFDARRRNGNVAAIVTDFEAISSL